MSRAVNQEFRCAECGARYELYLSLGSARDERERGEQPETGEPGAGLSDLAIVGELRRAEDDYSREYGMGNAEAIGAAKDILYKRLLWLRAQLAEARRERDAYKRGKNWNAKRADDYETQMDNLRADLAHEREAREQAQQRLADERAAHSRLRCTTVSLDDYNEVVRQRNDARAKLSQVERERDALRTNNQ